MSKFLTYAFLIQCLFMNFLLAGNGSAQIKSIEDVMITMPLQEEAIGHVFSKIEKASEFSFVYTNRDIRNIPKISLEDKSQSLYDVLKEIAVQTGLEFKQVNRSILVQKSKNQFKEEPVTMVENDIAITGLVTDTNGEPIPGVTVSVAGTTIGTATDLDGRYSLSVPEGSTLVFSFIGFETQRIEVGERSVIDITLNEDMTSLDEVVVVGYGTQKKSDLTGSVSSLKSKDFNPGVNASVDQLIQGRAAGVQITQTSSEPGGGISIRIRGASSINAGNEPLYVIDGLPIDNSSLLSGGGDAAVGNNPNPRNPLNALNPNDIESIEILKDASATAIYGSRGANGVILVTTKKGSKGEIKVNYDFQKGTQTPNRIDLLSAQEYIQVINGISEAGGNSPVFSESEISQIGAGTDWQDEIYRTAPLNNHNLSASGGDAHTTFFASLNYFDQDGVVKNSGIKKYIARINLERKIGERTQIGINLNTSLIKDNNNVDGINTNENAGPINTALLYDPTEEVFNSSGGFTQSPNLTINNPVSLIRGISSKNETNRTFGNFYIQHKITDDLDAKLNFGSDRQTSRRDIYNSKLTFHGASNNGIANIATLERSNVLLEYTMTYNKQLNETSSINILGGTTFQDFSQRRFSGTINNFPSDAIGTNNLSLGDTENDDLSSNRARNTLLSYLGRVNYSFFNKYLLTASLRADGSSRFGKNNKFGYFPSFAFGYKLAEENFIPQFFDDLKLRASWGQTGNQEIGNYASLSTFTTGSNAVMNDAVVVGTRPSRIANPDLKWETTEQFNIGIDASILAGRISGTMDYFIKNTEDMLINLPIPRATGFGSIISNIGKMENKGFEFLLNSTNISQQFFTWSTSLNFSAIKNKVKDLGESGDIITGNVQSIGNTTIITEGYPVNSYYGYEVIGIFQMDDNIAESAQPNSQPGYPIFRDVNGNNSISPNDQMIIGNPFPDYIFGVQNSFSYKSIQLSFFIQGQQGADLLNINVLESMYPANFRRNKLAEQALNRWTPENPNTKWPSGIQPSAYGGGKANTLALQDASYIRLKNVQLSYNLPVDNVRFLKTARIYITGQNLWTITDYVGFDPEANAFGRSNVRLDYNGYPLAKTWVLGINIGL
jgi:TonB-linked SusC/RagA family outer membrane protein